MASETLLKEHFDNLVRIFQEKILLDEDVKLVKETLGDEGIPKEDIAAMVAAATAKAREKLDEAKTKATKVQEMIERFA